ncbi:hypothetical protein COSO111634_27540 [Corallococcus soli]
MDAGGCVVGREGFDSGSVWSGLPVRSRMNEPTSGYRSAGCLAIARWMAATTCGGVPGASDSRGAGSRWTIW